MRVLTVEEAKPVEKGAAAAVHPVPTEGVDAAAAAAGGGGLSLIWVAVVMPEDAANDDDENCCFSVHYFWSREIGVLPHCLY